MKSLILTILLVSVPVFAGPPTDAVRAANTTITKLVQAKAPAAQVQASVASFLDIDELGKRAMGANWASMTAAQQKQFLQVLHALIAANYANTAATNPTLQVAYTGEAKQPDGDVLVRTTVTTQQKGRPVQVSVDYVVEKVGNDYRAVDVVTDGVGLVANYRDQFNAIVQKSGINGLIQKMQKKQSQLAAPQPSAPQTHP